MKMRAKNLDYWRNYFQEANSSIFDIIDNAIRVAAIDHPREFRRRRSLIAERLFTSHNSRCCGHGHNGSPMPKGTNNDNLDEESASRRANRCLIGNAGDLKIDTSNQTKVSSSRDVYAETKMSQVSNYSYSEAEELTDEIEEENETVVEVLRIREILANSQEQSESTLFDSLRRLQLMVLPVEILQVTNIGKVVNDFQGHWSKQISQLAQTLTNDWNVMVGEWNDTAAAIAESSTHSNPFTMDDEGLPSPPMDEGALFAAQIPVEFSQFFDGIDEDGNPIGNMEYYCRNHGSTEESPPENQNNTKRKSQLPQEATRPINEKNHQHTRQGLVNKSTRPCTKPGKSQRLGKELKVNYEIEFQNNPQGMMILKNQPTTQKNECKRLDDAAIEEKLEATKRKLQEGYHQIENVRKQRATKFLDSKEVPKQKLGPRNQYMKRKNYVQHLRK